jgi:predicted HicB family RNase H-like nuclease
VQSLPWIYNSTLMSLCQQKFDITLQFIYNIFEVIYMAMKPGTKTLSLRIDGELKFELEKEAVKQSRSVNNLLVHIIKQYFESEKKRGYRK